MSCCCFSLVSPISSDNQGKSEEELLETWNHPLTKEHKLAHQNLLTQANDMQEKLEEQTLSYQDVIDFYVNHLVLNHIIEKDKKFFFQI